MADVLYILYFVVGAALTVVLIRYVARSKRRLDTRVEEFREEQAANQAPPPDPWSALAELYAEDERKNAEARRGRGTPKRPT